MQGFQNQVVVVTGGASGIGKALCQQLAAAGAKLVIADINAAGAEAVALELGAEARHVDVSSADQVEALIEQTVSRHGRIDYLFNNAGIAVVGDARDLTRELWQAAIDVNLMGVIYGSQAAYTQMARQGSGHIVNVGSLAGLVGAPGMLPYSTTKAAVIALSRTLRIEALAFGVRVTAVCPGFIESNIYESSRNAGFSSDHTRRLISVPMVDTQVAARKILKGVLANRELIVFPAYAKVAWLLHRLYAPLITPLAKTMIARMRKLRPGA